MRIFSVVGARPQFIKASVVSRAIAETPGLEEILLHTGQHFDANMSDVFFRDLGIPQPQIRLDIHGGSHGEMTGRMLGEIEQALIAHKPDRVVVYGDTNSTLAAALAAAKLHIPVAHIEAGLRSFDRRMPEELNRILTDHLADILYCPTPDAVENLADEGIPGKHSTITVLNVGDVMEDSVRLFAQAASLPAGLSTPVPFVLATIHRADNTDDPERLRAIIEGLNQLHDLYGVVLPVHPRTRGAIERLGIETRFEQIDPVGYLEMLGLIAASGLVVTDSGGLQKEAFFMGRQCIICRDTTEWVGLIAAGVNVLVGTDQAALVREAEARFGQTVVNDGSLFGGGTASRRIADHLATNGAAS